MTIEEIKEWRKTAPAEPDYGELKIIDTLLAEVERLNEENERDRCHGRDFIRLWKEGKDKLTIATDALEKIITNCGTGSEGAFIARTALERIKG